MESEFELDKEYYKAERKAEWRDAIRKEMTSKARTLVPRIHMIEEDPNVRNKSNVEVNKYFIVLSNWLNFCEDIDKI